MVDRKADLTMKGQPTSGAVQFGSSTAATNTQRNTRTLDLSGVAIHCKEGTYLVLSYCVDAIRDAGHRSTEFISRSDLDRILHELQKYHVDLTSLGGFPYDAPDLKETLILMAKLQNRCALEGEQSKQSTIRDVIEHTLSDRSNKAHRYGIGEWVEVRGPSMRYRLEIIDNVVKLSLIHI